MNEDDTIPHSVVLPPTEPRPCPVCAAGSLGSARMRDVHQCKLTPAHVAIELNCTVEEVMRHINEQHEIRVNPTTGEIQSEDFYLKELASTLNTLKRWTNFVCESVQTKNDLDRAKVDMLTKLVQETRRTIETVAELQGRKGPGEHIEQINRLKREMKDITNIILTEVPPECQLRILDRLDRARLDNPTVLTIETTSSTSKS